MSRFLSHLVRKIGKPADFLLVASKKCCKGPEFVPLRQRSIRNIPALLSHSIVMPQCHTLTAPGLVGPCVARVQLKCDTYMPLLSACKNLSRVLLGPRSSLCACPSVSFANLLNLQKPSNNRQIQVFVDPLCMVLISRRDFELYRAPVAWSGWLCSAVARAHRDSTVPT